ncbi:chlorophyll(ide) b reductase NOL, chloroplastic-like isoform X1 [Camellia sinensis]|uniref:chlorophyll(ide) b reductase NOL, chloroplastic-like isoform X1 n=1 Tax=Camellia sinensis TaxID=4442 RepID=UPI001035FBB2|nr:chlorophyll(ide) b reductase NOL, chloroplastic-like isoform X1 [Camellia sinensis]
MAVVVQILSVVTYCYLQGVVHRDLKPEPGMVTTDLLLSGASTKQAKFFINVLVEPAEVVAEYLVPNIRSVPANGLSKPIYIRFLTGLKAYSQIFSVKWKKKMKRTFDSWFSIFKLWLLILLFFGRIV